MAIIKNYLDAELKNTNNSTNPTVKKPQDTIKPQQQPSILATASIMQNQIRNLAQSSPMLQQTPPTKSIVASASSTNKIEPKTELAGPYYDKTTNQIYFKNSVNNSISDASSNLNRYFVNSEITISAPPIQANSSASVSAPVVNSSALTPQTNPALNVTKNAASIFSVSGSINATPSLNKTEPGLKKYTLEDYLYKPVDNKNEKAAKPAAKINAKPSPALITKNTKPALPQILSSPPIAASASSLSPPQAKPKSKSPDPLTTRSELSFKSASSFVSNLDESLTSNEIMPTSTFEQLYFDDSYLFDSMNEATNPLYASSANSIEYNFSPISDRQPSSSSSSSKASVKLEDSKKAAHTKSSKSISPVSNDVKVNEQNNSKDEFNSESLLNEINFESETLSELDIKSDTETPNPDEMKELRSSPALRSSPDLVKSPTGNNEDSSTRTNGVDNEDELSEEEFFNAKNVNLFSFEPLSGGNSEEKSNEPIDQRYKKEYLDPKVFFNQQSRDLPAILENDAELMEEIEMKRLQEELKKEGKSANNYFNGYDEYSESGEDEDEDDEEEEEDEDDEEEETESYEYLY